MSKVMGDRSTRRTSCLVVAFPHLGTNQQGEYEEGRETHGKSVSCLSHYLGSGSRIGIRLSARRKNQSRFEMENHHALKDKRLSGMPSGILNSGNSCFANSALQSLLSTIAFRSGSVQEMKKKVSERGRDSESANKIPTPLL